MGRKTYKQVFSEYEILFWTFKILKNHIFHILFFIKVTIHQFVTQFLKFIKTFSFLKLFLHLCHFHFGNLLCLALVDQ